MKKLLLISIILFNYALFGQSEYPKREFRGAWIATVTNLDWPSSNRLTTDQQKAELIEILDSLKTMNINSVIFQVRSECDAMYNSPYDPWSYWLTGAQGRAPSPYYDPLQFAVQEAHKRGMQLQAWFNPYRAVRNVQSSYPQAPNHVTVEHPDWIVTYGNIKVLDPGLPQVRDYVTKVIMDVVRRYDIDGVHFDDYFYPYPVSGLTFNDAATFQQYPNGYTAEQKDDWRRNNVNLLVKEIYDSIQVVKPDVVFGLSPFGIWKSGVPAGIVGLSAYSDTYADGVYWLQHHIIDYIAPQLYWPYGGGQDYGKLMPWWASQTNGRHLYVGEAAYRISAWSSPSEMPNHIRASRSNPNCEGNIYFRAKVGLMDNERGFKDTLQTDLFKYPALLPHMAWKDSLAPNAPRNLKYERIASTGYAGLVWDLPETASDGDTAWMYVVYKSGSGAIGENDLADARNISDIVGEKISIPKTPANGSGYEYYTVTAIDRNSNESVMSGIVRVDAPAVPLLAVPGSGEQNQRDTVILQWNYPEAAASYRLQLSTDSTFNSGLMIDQNGITDTSYTVTGLEGQQKYYWRLSASNAGGKSDFSGTYSFETGFPSMPVLAYPEDKTYISELRPDFSWNKAAQAAGYRFQFAKSINFETSSIVVDTSGLKDTSYAYSSLKQDLELNRIYFWRVNAVNQYGTGLWSDIFRFKVVAPASVSEDANIPKEYELSQNYPNPFNPTTQIKFALAKSGYTTLKVYNMLGQEVAVLTNGEFAAGRYNVNFNASGLSSGIYIYTLRSGSIFISRKMMLLK